MEDKCLKKLHKPSYNRPSLECYRVVDSVGKGVIGGAAEAGKIWRKLGQWVNVLDEIRIDPSAIIRGPNSLIKKMSSAANRKRGRRFKIIPIKFTGNGRMAGGGLLLDSRKNIWELFLLPGVELEEGQMKKQEMKVLALIKEKFNVRPNMFYQYIRNHRGPDGFWPLFLVYLKVSGIGGSNGLDRELLVNKAIEIMGRDKRKYKRFIDMFT